MPKVSGLIVPKLCHTRHDGNNRCLEPVAPSAHHHDYGSGEDEEAQDTEEPKEPLGIVTEVAPIVFLVSLLNLPAFFDKHGIDLSDVLLHLTKHPLMFLVKQVLYLLPVGISDIDRNLQLVWSLLQNTLNVLIDSVNLVTDSIHGSTEHSFLTLSELDGAFQG